MPLPFLISCSLPAVGLHELSDGRFQLIASGPIAPLMSGFRYLLVEQPLAAFLADQGLERVRQEPVILFNRSTNEELRSHVRLHVGQFFQPSQLLDVPLDGLRLLALNDEFYFVSPELKSLLEASTFHYLRFSEGLSEFAGDLP